MTETDFSFFRYHLDQALKCLEEKTDDINREFRQALSLLIEAAKKVESSPSTRDTNVLPFPHGQWSK
ncbi:hypothetical protein [Bradyrhizobium prioriisuperbiae]|uniref:hypothetical protein n=1 Tax=Bradyrhizobium prioriisuperbiae TaxID=2854389 RepID=UPI0028E21D36|nr:hypothetical protein [Bradyrhizobium prioritasuperba]